MMSMRLFIAINFDEQTKDELYDIINDFKAHTSGGSFTLRENLHLTLVFIGETDKKQAAIQAINKISTKRFNMELSDIGSFRREGGDIFWAGIKTCPKLFALNNALTKNLEENSFMLDKRKFNPHLTLGRRVRLLSNSPDFNVLNKRLSGIHVPVEEISLMRSERINGRLTYSVIHSKKLI